MIEDLCEILYRYAFYIFDLIICVMCVMDELQGRVVWNVLWILVGFESVSEVLWNFGINVQRSSNGDRTLP